MAPQLAESEPEMSRKAFRIDGDWTAAREAMWQSAETIVDVEDGEWGKKAGWTHYGHQGALGTLSVKAGARNRTLRFERTCPYNPEQYDVFKGCHLVGYVRLRRGRLTADYIGPAYGPPGLDLERVEVLRQYFDDRHEMKSGRPGNFWVGAFLDEEQRTEWLGKIAEILVPFLEKDGIR